MINYTIYIEVTCCDSKGNVKTALVNDDSLENILSRFREYYTAISWKILLVPKRYEEK